MPQRKYEDLAHLSPEEYRIESQKRRETERKEYHRQKYLRNCDLTKLENRKKRIEEAIAAASSKRGLAAEGENNSPQDNNGGAVESVSDKSEV